VTLGEGKRKVYKLLDEYGTGEDADEELDMRLNAFFDTAQKDVAKVSRIIRTVTLSGEGSHPMPPDFIAVQRIWRRGSNITRNCSWRRGELLLSAGEQVDLDYFAEPVTVDDATPDDWEFEVREDACEAMLFFVAALVLGSDLVQDGQMYMELYEKAKGALSSVLPGGGQVANRIFG